MDEICTWSVKACEAILELEEHLSGFELESSYNISSSTIFWEFLDGTCCRDSFSFVGGIWSSDWYFCKEFLVGTCWYGLEKEKHFFYKYVIGRSLADDFIPD